MIVIRQVLKQSCDVSVSWAFCFHLQANDSGLASYVAGQIDRTLSWKVREYNSLENKYQTD